MTIDFYEARCASGDPIVTFDDNEIEVMNAGLRRKGAAFSFDPYGDTKLTDAHVQLTLSSIKKEEHADIQGKLSRLSDFEVCYGFGD